MTRTNAYTLLCVVIRAVAIASLLSFLIALPGQLSAARTVSGIENWATGIAVTFLVTLMLIGALWLFADKLARLALASPREQVFESAIEPEVWLGLAISAIGAWHLFAGLVDGCYWLMRLFVLRAIELELHTTDVAPPDFWAGVVATVAQAVLGLVCMLRGKGLARWFQRMRYGKRLTE